MAIHPSILAWRIPMDRGARKATVLWVTTFTPLTLFAVTCICRSPVPSIHLKFTNARGGIPSRCPAITAKSDGFRGLVASTLVLLVSPSDGGGRQGPDLETHGLGERRAWTSSEQPKEVIALTVFSFVHLFPSPLPFSGSGIVVPEGCAVALADLGGYS